MKNNPVLEEILLIDDNSFTNFLNKNTIMEMGIVKNIHVALDGFEALKYLKDCKEKNAMPDLILLDVIMPMVDGTEFIKWVKLLNLLNSSTKITALTGGGYDSRISELKELGLDNVLYKPLDKNLFIELIHKLFPIN